MIPPKTTFLSIVFFVAVVLAGCGTMEGDRSALDARRRYIISWVSKTGCAGSDECRVVGLGSKACGGPWDILVYPGSIDTANLLRMVSQYNADEDRFNREWSIASDCSLPRYPDSVQCFAGSCVGYWSGVRKIVGR